MRNKSLHSYRIVTVIVFLVSSILIPEPATAEQERSNEWRVSPRLARIENPITPDTSSLATGKNLYLRECQQCHGETGKGDGAIGAYLDKKVANLTSSEVLGQPDGAIYTKIRMGRTPMPGFKNSLAKDEIWHLINFIRSEFGHENNLSSADQTKVDSADSQSTDKVHIELFKKSEFPSAQECGAYSGPRCPDNYLPSLR
jgi:mono/diheme cytochrome c family protein